MKYLITTALLCLLMIAAPAWSAQTQNAPNQPVYNQQPAPNQPVYNQQPVYNDSNNSTYNQSNAIPAGTQLQIRTNDAIDATSADVGRTYSAEISNDVMNGQGQVIIPRGTPAELTIAQAGHGTLGVGSSQVQLALRSVNLNGRTYMVQTNTVEQSGNRGIGANKRTAEMTGGGAVLGTVIGAVAGGAKGAAIGAVLGGAGGATAQVLTRGNEVKIPSESVLTFKLDQPLTLQ